MSYHRPPSAPSSNRRSSSGRAYDPYADRDWRSSSRGTAPSSRSSTSASRSESGYRSNPHRDDVRSSPAARSPASSRPSSQSAGRRPPSSASNGHHARRSSNSNKRRKRKRSPFALFLPIVLIIALLALLIVGLKSCLPTGKDSGNYSLEFSNQTIVVGGTATVKVVGLPENFDGKITWSSSDNEVVKVNDGKLTAKKVGIVTISASVNGKNVPGTVKVIETVEGIQSITITPSTLTLLSGKTYQLQYTLKFEQETAPAVSPTWTSSNSAVASVSKDGLVTARDVGSTSITATVGNQSATCTITVEKDPNSQPAGSEEGIESNSSDVNSDPSGSTTSTTTPPPSTLGTSAAAANSGSSTASKPANTSSGNNSGTKSSTAKSLAFSQKEYYLDVGGTLVLEVSVSPSGTPLTWSSNHSAIATVTSGGLVTAKGAGTAVITVKAGGLSQTCKINVSTPSSEPSSEPSKEESPAP